MNALYELDATLITLHSLIELKLNLRLQVKGNNATIISIL